jgi:hypothetical protein
MLVSLILVPFVSASIAASIAAASRPQAVDLARRKLPLTLERA